MSTMNTLLVASDPKELAASQHRMIEDVAHKIEVAKIEAAEAKSMVQTVTSARLGVSTAKAIHRRATSRVAYLVKVKQALEDGYCMMPDMEGTIVAVRTDSVVPSPAARRGWGSKWNVPEERSKGLTAGHGDYVSPRPLIDSEQVPDGVDAHGKPMFKTVHRAVELTDPDGLNPRFVRPEVMSRTAKAMAAKLFDEIVAVSPWNSQARRSRDPIVLGRIVDPVNRSVAAFLVAWFVDTAQV